MWKSRKFIGAVKLVLAGVTVFCVSWIASVGSWAGEGLDEGQGRSEVLSTMRTIVAYSEGKQAELLRSTPLTCDRLPSVPHVPEYNRTWYPGVTWSSSWQPVPGTKVVLYAAYYDQRTSPKYARILAKFKGRQFDSSSENQLYCQMRPQHSEELIEVVAARPLEIWYHEWDATTEYRETPLLLSCPLPAAMTGPLIVSVVSNPCDNPRNAFLLNPAEQAPVKRSFTVCVKDMRFNQDISLNLIEWIETNKILGAEMFDIYVDDVNKKTENVLMYYRNKGIVRLFQVPIKFNDGNHLWQRRRDHIISYNDCLYRNIKESMFIIPLDVDEVIFPKIAYNWKALIERLHQKGWNPKEHSSILIRNTFFFESLQFKSNKIYAKRDDVRIYNETKEDINNKNRISKKVIDNRNKNKLSYISYKTECGKVIIVPKFLRHLVRSAYVSPMGSFSKSMMATQRVLTAFNHYPLNSFGKKGHYGWPAPLAEVQLNHYKELCNETMVDDCEKYNMKWKLDVSALRLRERLLPAITDVICDKINPI